jgi:hypothetical protein
MACAGTALRKVQTADSLRESSRKFSAGTVEILRQCGAIENVSRSV